MKEEYAQSSTPQWGGAELKRASRALRNAVGEPVAHVVQKQVGEQVHRPVFQDRTEQCRRCLHRGRMTQRTTYFVEQIPAVLCAGARVGIGLRGVREAHHELELHPVPQDVERVFERLLVWSLVPMRVTSFGSGFSGPLQPGSSSLACGNSSLVMPISTL